MNKPVKMRSSIACVRCRRSKVKCVNNGMNSKCRACDTQNRECTYPPPASGSSSTPKRIEAPSGLRPDGESDVKRARKKEPDASIGRKQPVRNGDDPLETPTISFKLWEDIFRLFGVHFSTDLPFLHEATFFRRVTQEPRSLETQMLLLGMLSLTARFIPELVSYAGYPPLLPPQVGDPRLGEPLYASEFYARALEDRLDIVTIATPSLETIHALLMLGVHKWGMGKGLRAWMSIGSATRLAYAMQLGTEEELPDPTSNTPGLQEEARRLGVKEKRTPGMDTQACIDREVRRRTMWSCFILDRYLSTGRSRPHMDVLTLEIQLPCSEEDFRFGSNSKTEFLTAAVTKGSNSSSNVPLTQMNIIGLFIRLVDIWGACSKYSCAGGRRKEQYPPWDENSNFFRLREQLNDFKASLPGKLTFTPTNLSAHVGGTSMSVYCSIHTLYSLCQVVLHREYIPFIPLGCQEGPSGPLDEPTFPKDKHNIPNGFWEESAEHVFSSARDITEILKANNERKILIESPQILFAVWTAAFCGVYADIFPWMDPGCYMCDPSPGVDAPHRGGRAASILAYDALSRMQPNLKMASTWTNKIKAYTKYYHDIREDYKRNVVLLRESQLLLSLGNPQDSRQTATARKLSLREGGHGGGLHEYILVEKSLKEFPIEEDDEPSGSDRHERGSSRASTGLAMTPQIKSEAMQGIEMTATSRPNSEGTWAAVNTLNGADMYGQRTAPVSYKPLTTAGQGSRQDFGYDHAAGGMVSSTPSLVSSQNAQATPSNLSSPFGRAEHAAPHLSDSTYPNDPQQHSQQMAEYSSSALHPQPVPCGSSSGPPQMGGWRLDPNVHIQQEEAYVHQWDGIVWGGADVTLHRGDTPYEATWPLYADPTPGMGMNFIEAMGYQ